MSKKNNGRREKRHMAVQQLETLWEDICRKNISRPNLPEIDPEADDWDSLAAFCSNAVKQAGLTKEDSERIIKCVRKRIYGDCR